LEYDSRCKEAKLNERILKFRKLNIYPAPWSACNISDVTYEVYRFYESLSLNPKTTSSGTC